MEEKIKILSLFFSKQRVDGSEYLETLLELDELWDKTYREHRRESFQTASLIANETVISNVIYG
jgi:hypothetical protein